MSRVLLVDDDQDLCELLSQYLGTAGFSVSVCHSGPEAIDSLNVGTEVDAMVLDIMMPGMSGLDVLRHVRESHNVPIIMLTGRGDDIDRIVGLEMGADDYLGKPCNPRELVARLNAVLRRGRAASVSDAQEILYSGDLILNPGALSAKYQNVTLELTAAEFRVLHLLVQHRGETLSKEFLTQTVLQRPLTPYDRSIDVHISRVRQKLGKLSGANIEIKSVRGVGYQWVTES